MLIECPAKINLALSVGAPDPGYHYYHPIASWMVAVNFFDRLDLERTTDKHSRFDIRFSNESPQPQRVDWPLEKDITVRAHAAMERHTERRLPVAMRLEKFIPASAGLAGGSSDAAGMLYGLNRLFELDLSEDKLLAIAGELGSDVHFLMSTFFGRPSAMVSGFGEKITPVDFLYPLRLVLVLPPIACSTAAVYTEYDRGLSGQREVDQQAVMRLVDLAGNNTLRPEELFNDLAEPAMHVQPQLRTLCDKLSNITESVVHITGSGAAMFILTDSGEESRAMAKHITSLTDLPALYVKAFQHSNSEVIK